MGPEMARMARRARRARTRRQGKDAVSALQFQVRGTYESRMQLQRCACIGAANSAARATPRIGSGGEEEDGARTVTRREGGEDEDANEDQDEDEDEAEGGRGSKTAGRAGKRAR
jgi:hypothetical protein